MGKVRRTRLLARDSSFRRTHIRDVSLVFVATEDTYAAKQYLDALQEAGLVDRSRVKIISLPTRDGRSSLHALLERLREHERQLDIHLDQDGYWAVFDVDHHGPKELSEAVQKAKTRGHRLAGSNPCFELWLLLHLTDDIRGIAASPDDPRAPRDCEQKLHKLLQQGNPQARGYNKTRIRAERFAIPEFVHRACQNARTLMSHGPWPSTVGTHVYRLIESLPSEFEWTA